MSDVKIRLEKLEAVTGEPEPEVWTSKVSEDGRELQMLKNGKVVYVYRVGGNMDLREI